VYERRAFIAATGAAAVALAGCSSDGETTDSGTPSPTPAGETVVEMTDGLRFDPATVTVGVGETVVWETVGSVAHSVTAVEEQLPADAAYWASGGFDSESAARSSYPDGSVGSGETYSHTFETPGEHDYFCIPHAQPMRGTVVVE
jgi:plastocyanin